MTDDSSFPDFTRWVRAGEATAAADLVCRYETVICRIVRVQCRDARLRRLFDEQDICQSVLGSFFVRAALGQYELDRPEQLLHLLVSMARNKLARQVERQQAQRRDYRRLAVDDCRLPAVAAIDRNPSEQVAAHELLRKALHALSPQERQRLEWRQLGRSWAAASQPGKCRPCCRATPRPWPACSRCCKMWPQ